MWPSQSLTFSPQVERVYTMYINGNYTENKKPFSEVHWGPTTLHYVTCTQETDNKWWAEVFQCLNTVIARKWQAEYANHSGPQLSEIHQPIPKSDAESDLQDHPPQGRNWWSLKVYCATPNAWHPWLTQPRITPAELYRPCAEFNFTHHTNGSWIQLHANPTC